MQTRIITLTLCVLFGQALFAQVPPWLEKHGAILQVYYKDPQPQKLIPMFDELLQKENIEHEFFEKKPHVLEIVGSFLGNIAQGNSDAIRHIETQFMKTGDAGRLMIVAALLNCGDQKTLAVLDTWLGEEQREDVAKLLDRAKEMLSTTPPTRQHDVLPSTPGAVDLLWANFFVTGEYKPIARILDIFDQKDLPASSIMRRVARWSFESNLKKHPRLRELVLKNKEKRPAASRKIADAMLDATDPTKPVPKP